MVCSLSGHLDPLLVYLVREDPSSDSSSTNCPYYCLQSCSKYETESQRRTIPTNVGAQHQPGQPASTCFDITPLKAIGASPYKKSTTFHHLSPSKASACLEASAGPLLQHIDCCSKITNDSIQTVASNTLRPNQHAPTSDRATSMSSK